MKIKRDLNSEDHLIDENKIYFQFQGSAFSYPIFITFDVQDSFASLSQFLETLGFHEVHRDEVEKSRQHKSFRLLKISLASSVVARQIEMFRSSDRYGYEGLTSQKGHKVYRLRGVAMMVFSLGASDWEMGCFRDFGSQSSSQSIYFRSVMNRFLSWSLASMGVVGFWGVPVDEGVVILKQKFSQGEAVYFDLYNRKLIGQDGVRSLSGQFQIMRLDSSLRAKSLPMKTEELSCFLFEQTTYLDEQGLPSYVRQLIQSLSKQAQGMVYPRENFLPRKNLAPDGEAV